MKICFDIKFCEKHLDEILKSDCYNHSFKEKNVIFDLSKIEWINTEEIVFLFSWIRELTNKNINVKIHLPFPYKYDSDSEYNLKRRRRINIFLLAIWGMMTNVGLRDLDFENIIGDYNSKLSIIKDLHHKIIPFTVLKPTTANINKNKINIGKESSVIYGNFNLTNDIRSLLEDYACYSPFESKIISHIITKELFINSLEHSQKEESYFGIALNNKWDNKDTSYFIDHFLEEKHLDTINFYKDKKEIKKNIEKLSLTEKQKERISVEIREANLNDWNIFKNQSCLEFTFLDYGKGIYSTLAEKFHSDENKKIVSSNENTDTQILEYAFQIESSKDPLDRYEINEIDLIPRGLYFLVDMVRRFKGLLVARSGYGKIVYDFSDRIYVYKSSQNEIKFGLDRLYNVSDAIRPAKNNGVFFAGTMISIVLPEKDPKELKKSPVRPDNKRLNEIIYNSDVARHNYRELFYPESFEYISMAILYHEATLPHWLKDKQENQKNKIFVSNFIFKEIEKKIDSIQNKNCILFIDFEFLPERDNYLKIISWLTNTPKINEFSKVIITNLTEDESQVISMFKENFNKRDDVDFVYKAIPCIKITNQLRKEHIQWVGIKNENTEALLTNLFLGKNEYPLSYFEQLSVTQGHIIGSQEDSVFCLFNDTKKLIDSFSEAKRGYIEDWIANNSNIIVNGIHAETNRLNNIYQTSKGYYQTKYVTFFETLHNKYISELFAKVLLDRFVSIITPGEENKKEEYAFNKIVAVTVSSQLLGSGLRALIESKEDYAFLKSESNRIPEIISLASYFSFDSERPFEKIKANDKVLIVNDVIATGSLNKKLIEKVIEKGASISAIMTIVDLRDGNDSASNKIENTIISILSSSANEKISIQKYDSKEKIDGYSKEIQISRINPILNSIITLKHEHSENSRVLFKDSKDFLELCPKEIFRIGHYKQNLTHNSYFTDMSRLFDKEIGVSILETLKSKIEEDSDFIIKNNNELQATIQNIEYNLSKLNSFVDNTLDETIQNSIKEILTNAKEYSKEQSSTSFQYSPDYIFYPAFSSIEKVKDKCFQQVFKTDIDNINSLQRYDTRNGWRFPFPAKRYNELIKGRHVLIIDSGSLTGDSLIQLIDSISFLEVGRIDFISIIGRIDDFQRELYSRLRSIKVKNLKIGSEEDCIPKVVPLNILFATNLHIPPFPPEKCPFCVEFEKINSYLGKNLPKHARDYIEYRKSEIGLIEGKAERKPLYIPLKENEIDYEEIFIMRDYLGKVDGYRFYQEYFKYFDSIIDQTTTELYHNQDILKKYELILICISHEPILIGALRDLLVEIYRKCQTILIDIVEKRVDLNCFNYAWNEYALVRLLFIFDEELATKPSRLEKVFEFILDTPVPHKQEISDEQELALGYISFNLFEPICNGKETSLPTIIELEKNRKESVKKLYKKDSIRNLINEIVKNIEPTKDLNVLNAFNNLFLFFSQDYREQHNKLLKSQISMFRNLLGNEPLPNKDIKNYIHSIVAKLEDTIFEYIKVIRKSPIYKVDIPNNKEFFSSDNSIYSELKQLIALERSIESKSEDSNLEILFRDFESKIVDIQIKYLNDGKPFYEFCNKHSVNLKECISTVLRDEEIKKLQDECNCKISGIENCDKYVAGNEFYFISAFAEIFKNAFKRKNTQINLSYEKEELTILQNKPNTSMPKNGSYKSTGGIETILKPVFTSLYGEKGITFKHEDTYKIIINFNKN